MEGMLHRCNKSDQASNTLTSFGPAFQNAYKGLLSVSPELAFTPECLPCGHPEGCNPLYALSPAGRSSSRWSTAALVTVGVTFPNKNLCLRAELRVGIY